MQLPTYIHTSLKFAKLVDPIGMKGQLSWWHSLTIDLFQLEESCRATLKANKMHVKSVFSVESIKIMGSWYGMQWCLTYVPTSWWNLAFPSSSSEGKNSHTLKRGAARSSKLFGSIYQTSWSHMPWLYSQPTEVPITYHMPRFNVHEH